MDPGICFYREGPINRKAALLYPLPTERQSDISYTQLQGQSKERLKHRVNLAMGKSPHDTLNSGGVRTTQKQRVTERTQVLSAEPTGTVSERCLFTPVNATEGLDIPPGPGTHLSHHRRVSDTWGQEEAVHPWPADLLYYPGVRRATAKQAFSGSVL